MKVHGIGNETYLFINGLGVNQQVSLGDNIELLPATPSFDLDIIADLVENQLDYGVALIFLPLVKSQLHLTSTNPKSLTITSWNSLWDLVLFSALFNCDAVTNIQCDKPIEEISKKCTFDITNHHFRGLSLPMYSLNENDILWIEDNFSSARYLLNQPKFQNAVHCLATYHWHSLPKAQLALLWSGIEGLFNIHSELVFRLSLYISHFIEKDDKENRKEIFNNVKNLYKQRSKAVHGSGKIKDPEEAVTSSVQLLRNIIYQCIDNRGLPNQDKLVP